ncbi:MAG TPA: potassium channel protein [Acidimicrobiia bacterium]|jgi:voltage-gated potassium channel|nr:potassium channel protein [Acidimicrobiia bacterium]
MTERQRLRWAVAVLGAIVVIGTAGYVQVQDLSLLDALYFTVITVSTVGFAEPPGGFTTAGQALTIAMILMGVGAAFYTAVTALELLIDEMVGGSRRQRREEKMIARLEGHAIVCGYGRVGTSVANRLSARDVELVIVDDLEDRIERARVQGFATVRGDATHEDVLSAAGVDRASVVIACVHSDSDNLSVVLSARVRRPDLYILARASDTDAERRIKMAGADRVITPPEVGAERLAALVLHPGLTEFVDIAAGGTLFEFRVEELTLGPESELANVPLAESRVRSRVGASILAIRHAEGRITTNPPPTMNLVPGDVLVAIGTVDQLRALEKLV